MTVEGDAPDIIFEGADGSCPVEGCGVRYDRLSQHMSDAHPDVWAKFRRRGAWVNRDSDIDGVVEEVKKC